MLQQLAPPDPKPRACKTLPGRPVARGKGYRTSRIEHNDRMKLFYFDTPGRAEIARVMLDLAGIEFEDVRFSREEWASKYKAMSPTGQCPMLELEGGEMIVQSTAVNTYVARKLGFMPSDPLKAARTYELMATFEEFLGMARPSFAIKDVNERTAARKALMSPGGAMYAKAELIEKLLARTSSKYYLGGEPTLADIVVFTDVLTLTDGQLDGLDASSMSDFPRLSAIAAAVNSIPELAGRYDCM